MSLTKLPEDYLRFFARITSADLSCPQCGRVERIRTTTNRRIWDPRSARFQCLGCGKILRLGVVAWNVTNGRYSVSRDQTLTVREALALRAELSVWLQTRLMPKQDRNVLVEVEELKVDERGIEEPKEEA
jgi:predicted RNA-binding Zn-ribbon protein involved in translation (DUF1610 family)